MIPSTNKVGDDTHKTVIPEFTMLVMTIRYVVDASAPSSRVELRLLFERKRIGRLAA